MSISCPNKRLKAWKDLVQNVGENKAYVLWAEYNGNVPDNYYQVEDNIQFETNENQINTLLDPKVTKEVFAITDLTSSSTTNEVDNSQVNKQLLFNTNNQNSLLTAEVLTNIIEQIPDNLTDEFKVLIDKARKVLDNTKAKVEVSTIEEMSKKYNNISENVAMAYDYNNNKIIITNETLTFSNSKTVIRQFIHEVVHAITKKALTNPQTFEEKEFKKLVELNYAFYWDKQAQKQIDKTGDVDIDKQSYGFTNIDEFVAEIYSNPDFVEELKSLNNYSKNNFWTEFINSIRRLLGLPIKYNEFVEHIISNNDKIINFIETNDNSNFKGTASESGIKFDALFFRNTVLSESEGYNLDTIEKQIQNVLNKAKDVLNQNIAHYKAVTKSIKDPIKKQQWVKFVDNFDNTLSSLETLKDGEELNGILNYVNSLQKGVASLKSSFDKKEFTEEETIQVVHNYTKYLDSFTIHKDIQKLLSDIKVNNKFDSDTIDISEIEDALDSVVSDYTKLKSEYSAFLKNAIKLKLSTLKYLPELETMWINKLKTEYKSSPKSISQTEWIANAMNTTYKEDIDADIEDYLNKLINNPSFDISIGTHFFNDSINTNSHLIQIFNQILNEVKEEINQTMREKEAELKNLFDKLVKEKGSSNPSVLYKNLVFKNPNGNYSLVQNGQNLTDTEWEVVKALIEIQDYTDYSTYRKQSKKVKINGKVYYELPSITKSDLERVLEGDIKGTIKDKWTDLTTIKADDVEFRYKTDNDHNLIYNVPVRYRAKIEAKDQSLDLFTIYRLEYLNGVNFKVKTKAEKDLTTILDIAKSKEYYRNEGGKNFVKSMFSKNNEIELTPGDKSNTVKRLESLLEKNIYDIGNKYAGKMGPVDINKAISFANSATAAIGLNLNRYAATANVLNAKAQMFLESISKGTINKTNLAKAELLYTKELGNTMKDLGQPVEKSFINQMNRMFDTFGFDRNSMNDFVKQGLLKSYVNPGSLQFMHKTGEHWVQSVLTAAVLDSVKVMNSNNRFIDKKGNEVSEDKAASLLDMLYIDSKDGILKIDDKVVYTTKSLTSKINEGGKEKINLLIKKKIFDCFGNYDSNTQPEAKRHAWGKLLLMFRGFFTEMLTKRYKAFGTSLKSKDEIDSNPDKYKHYNYALQEYDEGTYTSLVRFLKHGVIPMLKQMKFSIASQEWDKLTDLEKANIKHSTAEITATLVILPLVGMLLGSMLGGNDDDDEIIYFWMYQTRRLTTELAQFRNPSENIKMTRSPIPSMRLIENGIDAIGKTLNFWSWDERLESGPNKGDLKIGRAYKQMIPVLNQIDKQSKDLYDYQKATFGIY